MSSEKIAIVTVHGTGDTAEGLDGEKWFQRGSEFATRLQGRLSAQGVDSEIVPHLWSGANSASAREKGSMALAKEAKKLSKTHAGVHVIGHSHGGNVANDAACMLNWHQEKQRPRLASVTTVGTPFFRTIVHRSEKVGAWAFLLMVIVSLCMVGFSIMFFGTQNDAVANADLAQQVETLEEAGEELGEIVEDPAMIGEAVESGGSNMDEMIGGLVVVGIFSGLVIAFIFPLAFRGIARIRRAGRKPRTSPKIHTIWHPNDEAIAFLQRVEVLPVEVFPKWSLLKGSRTGAILWGVRAAIWTPLLGLLVGVIAFMATDDNGDFLHPTFDMVANVGIGMALVGLFGAPILFGGIYLLYRAFVALFLEFGLRGYLNGVVGNALRGIAMGRDGDNRIGEVSEKSHYFGCDATVLEGELASRMLDNSHEATSRLFNKYREGLFSVGVGEDNAVAELAEDAMTWDSLVHTTYFDQPEIADIIADRIAQEALGKGRRIVVDAPVEATSESAEASPQPVPA